jgi:Flp pilus assembly protein TadB
VARQRQQPSIRWIEEAEDPELERRLLQELEQRRRARHEERHRRALEKRSRRLFALYALVTLALVVTIGYGVLTLSRSVFGG